MKILAPLWYLWKSRFKRENTWSFEVFSSETELDLLAEKHGTDKGGRNRPVLNPDRERHNYSQVYDFLLASRKSQVSSVFECGIGSKNQSVEGNMGPSAEEGASLRVWRDYFPQASIVGVDIDSECLFQEERIRTFQCDQTNRVQVSELFSLLDSHFDLIVDDGLHTFDANLSFLNVAHRHLRTGGYHVIEDVHVNDLGRWKSIAESDSSLSELVASIVTLRKPGGSRADNNLVIFRRP